MRLQYLRMWKGVYYYIQATRKRASVVVQWKNHSISEYSGMKRTTSAILAVGSNAKCVATQTGLQRGG